MQLLGADVANVFCGVLLTGVVDENVEAAELGDRLRDDLFARLGFADVGLDRNGAAALAFDDRHDGVGIVLVA